LHLEDLRVPGRDEPEHDKPDLGRYHCHADDLVQQRRLRMPRMFSQIRNAISASASSSHRYSTFLKGPKLNTMSELVSPPRR